MSKTLAEPREKDKTFSKAPKCFDAVKVEYNAVGRMRATAVMVINDERTSAVTVLNLTVNLLKEADKMQQPRT
jgi:hypothetical protein